MRLIDADALIDKYGDWYTEEGTEEGYIGTIKGIVDSMPTIEPEPQWIPCSERLPEALQEVLVTSTNGRVYTSRIVHGDFEYGGNVVAWMPLPEPFSPDDFSQHMNPPKED